MGARLAGLPVAAGIALVLGSLSLALGPTPGSAGATLAAATTGAGPTTATTASSATSTSTATGTGTSTTGTSATPSSAGYWVLTSAGGVANFAAPFDGSPKAGGAGASLVANPVVGMSATGNGLGYDVLRANGGVDNFHTPWDGSLADRLPARVHAVAIAAWPGMLSVATASLPTPKAGSPYAATLEATGGLLPDRWSPASGSLPAGLTLAADGEISGIPTTPGPSTFSVQVRDLVGVVATKTFGLTAGAASPLVWSKAVSIDPMEGNPTSVSCPTPTFCVAVDTYGNALTWNGKDWSAPEQIDANAGTNDPLASVSCPNSTFCVAVAADGNAFRWNGTSWSAPESIYPTPPNGIGLTSVSCASPSFCIAVGGSGSAVIWDGSSWASPQEIEQTSLTCSPA